MMNEIQQWVKAGRHWDPGKSLLERHSGNAAMKRFFRTCNPTNENQDMLLYELKKLIPTINESTKITQPAASNGTIEGELHSEKPIARSQEVDEEIARLDEKWRVLYKEMAGIKLKLMHYPNDEERKVAAFKVLDLFDECRAIWKRRDTIIANGALPKIERSANNVTDDPVKLITNRNNLRTRISKTKSRMQNQDEKVQQEKKLLIAKWQVEIVEIETKLLQLGWTN